MRSIKATVQEVKQYFKPNLGEIKMSKEGFYINLLLQIQEKSPSAHRSYCSAGSVRLDRLQSYLSGNQNLMRAHLLGQRNGLEGLVRCADKTFIRKEFSHLGDVGFPLQQFLSLTTGGE